MRRAGAILDLSSSGGGARVVPEGNIVKIAETPQGAEFRERMAETLDRVAQGSAEARAEHAARLQTFRHTERELVCDELRRAYAAECGLSREAWGYRFNQFRLSAHYPDQRAAARPAVRGTRAEHTQGRLLLRRDRAREVDAGQADRQGMRDQAGAREVALPELFGARNEARQAGCSGGDDDIGAESAGVAPG
jgi:hypothetical protein